MSDSEIKNVGEILDLTKQLEAIEKERSTVLNKLAKAVGKGVKVKKPATRRRGPRPGSAVAYAVQVLEDAGRPLTINELVEGINKKGFTSKAKNPATSVAQQLYKSPYVKAKAGKFSLP